MKKLLLASGILLALASCNSGTEQATPENATAKVLDPVCKMEKDASWTEYTETHGQIFYFCSPVCKEQFDKDPHKYLDAHAH
ncbi:MAG: hypothetical protein BGO09_13000 [Bacteroidetes bacterium 47-18]|nr:MAG: hypothetical protein BGO09_13000 [Bacteroidetes bacterium 47-18]